MMKPNPNFFAGNPLDRAGVRRKDPDWVADQRARSDAKFLPFDKSRPLVRRDEDAAEGRGALHWLSADAMNDVPAGAEFILLGLKDGIPHWAADVTADPPLFEHGAEHIPLREACVIMPPEDSAVSGFGAWLLDWHRRHRFCARYGNETVPRDGGFKRVNVEKEVEHFPRTDPVTIMLPFKQDQVCMGRGPHFPEGMFSALAGFVEACETLEECVARELKEEVGLIATDIEYLFSQPWPFPSSLMVGFLVEVEDTTLNLDPDEIVEARWFSRAEARALLSGHGEPGLFVPPRFAIAHQLLKVWVDR